MITKDFRIRYLWIDALCILQDSVDDWRSEASTMTDVYRNSYCNISATGASGPEQGCFFQRDPFLVPPIVVRGTWDKTTKMSYNVRPKLFSTNHVDLSPLNLRAWVLQERILSSRILHCGKEQLLWECLEMDACETYPNGVPGPRNHQMKMKSFGLAIGSRTGRELALEPAQRQSISIGRKYDLYYWPEIVTAYTRGKLTRADDKLVAISGLAKRLQSMTGDEYLAGLWRSSLPYELTWQVDSSLNEPRVRPTFFRAPTWSWASVDTPVSYGFTANGPRHGHIMIEVIASGVDVVNADPTGQLTNGFIRLSGSVIPCRIGGRHYDSDLEVFISLGLRSREIKGRMRPDVPRTESDPSEVFCLPILNHGDPNSYFRIKGIILETFDPSRNVYKRCGHFEIWSYENFSDGYDNSRLLSDCDVHRQDITLV